MMTSILTALALTGAPEAHAEGFDAPPPVKVKLNEDGSAYLRLITWHQVWMRAIDNNPGTTVQGEEADWTWDVGLRRSRFLALGQLNERVLLVTHFGVNNQTFNNTKKPQLFMHGAWGQVDVVPGALTLGAGLHYWQGPWRISNASTLNFLGLDAPIVNWVTIERTDQFARNLGVFAKGRLGKLDYRVAVNKPFATAVELSPGGPADTNSAAHSYETRGYVSWAFAELEGNTLPYMVGSYLGKKKVVNLGAGWTYQPEGVAQMDADGEVDAQALRVLGADLFVDLPLPGDSALTAYAAYGWMDYGADHVRNVGIMNLGAGGTSFNGGGNAYPTLGTGHHVYVQAGYLLPVRPGGLGLQPYASAHVAALEALDDPMIVLDGGVNWLIVGHHAKVTTHYRSRPIFEAQGEEIVNTERRSEVIAQLHVML